MTRRPSKERPPFASVVDAKVDESRIQRVWRGVEPHLVGDRGRRGVAIDRRVVFGASLVLVALFALALSSRPVEEPARFLALADGTAPAALTAHEAEVITFADGSRIALGAGAEIVPTLNDAHDFAITLTRGTAGVAVTPGGPRRWRIDCGLALVEVVGTEFQLERADDGVRVSVQRGHVRVTASDARAWDLLAGDEVWVEAPAGPPAEAVRAEPVVEVAAPSAAPVEAPSPVEPRAVEVARASRWTELAESGAYGRAYDVLEEEGGSRHEVAIASPRELLLLADVARLSGHPSEAVEPLERLIALHSGAPEAPLAAVVLGRLEQDALHAPAAAARAFERAEQLGVPASLAADVEGRLALAYLALDDPRGGERARRYLEAHPDGPHASVLAARLE